MKNMMNSNYKLHITAFLFLFTIGDVIIILPFYKCENYFTTFLSMAIFSLVYVLLFTIVFNKLTCQGDSQLKKSIYFIFLTIVLFLAVYGVYTSVNDYVSFVKKVQLTDTNALLITVVFVLTAVAFIKSKFNAMLKFCLILSSVTAFLILLLFVLPIDRYDLKHNIFETEFSKEIIFLSLKYFLRYFSSLAVAITFIFLNYKPKCKNIFCGTAFGFMAIFIITVQTVMILGKNTNYNFAYFYAVSVYSSGSLFSRVDGLVYLIFFVSVLSKTAVCIKTFFMILNKIKVDMLKKANKS